VPRTTNYLSLTLVLGVLPLHAGPSSPKETPHPVTVSSQPSSEPMAETLSAIEKALDKGDSDLALQLLAKVPQGTPLRGHEDVPLLLLAAGSGSLPVVQELLRRGAKVNEAGPDNLTALMLACLEEKKEVIDLLLREGADPRAVGPKQLSVFDIAIASDNPEVLKRIFPLVSGPHGALPKGEHLSYELAIKLGRFRSIEWLLNQAGLPEGEALAELVEAAGSHDGVKLMGTLLDHPQAALRFSKGRAEFLKAAASAGKIEHLTYLLERGYPLVPECLTVSLKGGHLACAQWLLSQGLSLSSFSAPGSSPLLEAAAKGRSEVVAFLLAARVDVKAQTRDGLSALDLALESGDKDTQRLLQVAGLRPSGKGLHWEEVLETAMARAKAEGKPVFLDLWAGWCGPCMQLKRETFPSAIVRDPLLKVVPLSIEVQDAKGKANPIGEKLSETYHLKAFPTLLVLDADGKELRRHVGFLDPESLKTFLEGREVPNS